MGGSAASAVAALVAANALLETPLGVQELYPYAVEGEAAATGAHHGDNVGPMLLGGLTLSTHRRVIPLPVPENLTCIVVHPHFVLETREARAVLSDSYALSEFVAQSERLAQFIAGLFTKDIEGIRAGLDDVLIEPRRAHLIPGFGEVKRAALDAGALGSSISGGGPSVFAWFESRHAAIGAVPSMREGFTKAGLASDVFVSPVGGPKARLIG
jgi:homoserine kinase